MTWVTTPGSWDKNSKEESEHGPVAIAHALFNRLGATTLTSVTADTSAKPVDANGSNAKAVASAVYEFKREWSGAPPPLVEDFEFNITYTPSWKLTVEAPDNGTAKANETIKVVISAVNGPISVPPPHLQQDPNPPVGQW